MNKVERSLLLYVESCCTDFGGLLDPRKINVEELTILNEWDAKKYIGFSRLTSESIQSLTSSKATHAVTLSEQAWTDAHAERMARFTRLHTKRTWQTTNELRAESNAQ